MNIYMGVCVCTFVCMQTHTHIYLLSVQLAAWLGSRGSCGPLFVLVRTPLKIYIFTSLSVSVCGCVYGCVWVYMYLCVCASDRCPFFAWAFCAAIIKNYRPRPESSVFHGNQTNKRQARTGAKLQFWTAFENRISVNVTHKMELFRI